MSANSLKIFPKPLKPQEPYRFRLPHITLIIPAIIFDLNHIPWVHKITTPLHSSYANDVSEIIIRLRRNDIAMGYRFDGPASSEIPFPQYIFESSETEPAIRGYCIAL
jgi:hypothetical protein